MNTISSRELIEHAHFSNAWERAEHTIQRALAGESLMLPIFGPTRVGKTELIKFWAMYVTSIPARKQVMII